MWKGNLPLHFENSYMISNIQYYVVRCSKFLPPLDYTFIESIFDPDIKWHVQNLKKTDPINFETVSLDLLHLYIEKQIYTSEHEIKFNSLKIMNMEIK